jgi:predicted dehydrogenase
MRTDRIRVAVVGVGYWGPNWVRNLSRQSGVDITVCDLDLGRLEQIAREFRGLETTKDLDALLADPAVTAVVVSTPATTHFELGRQVLEAGKHVLIEKPLSFSTREARELVDLAAGRGLTLMTGHTFEYNPAVIRLRALIQAGELGRIFYTYSMRLNLGQIREDVNAMWNLAPHDVSILVFLLGELPVRVSARGTAFLQEGIEDVVLMTLEFPSGILSHIHVSWLDPRKNRTLTVVGDRKMVVFDDVDNEAKLRIYDKGVSRLATGDSGEYFYRLRSGDIHIPRIEMTEPLANECQHFLECIRTGARPRTDGENGVRVVQVLEAAQASLKAGGAPVQVT